MSKSALRTRGIATGIAALAVSALAAGVVAAPAQAHDNGALKSESSKSDHNTLGARLYETKTIKLADGTIVAKNSRKGTITAVDATTVTVTSADASVVVYTPAANTELRRNGVSVALTAFVVGDTIKVKSYTISAVETVVELSAKGVVAPATVPATRTHHDERDHHKVERKFASKGTAISTIATYKKVDGTFVTVAHYFGIVASVTDTTVTVTSADGASTVYTVGAATITRDHVAATLAQLVAGDRIRVSGTITASVLTVSTVKAKSAAAWSEHRSHEDVADQVVVTKANKIKADKAKKIASKKHRNK
ncbi:MAG: hypothetical protein RL441_668 [Actinomycetota bacterium]|jgi:hypothetical protein